ncbi:MAG: hypothetical protein HOP16_21735 [Acidobacteria bacterium]|nr:hypothetical protein [Acidobacteriota bacterium]
MAALHAAIAAGPAAAIDNRQLAAWAAQIDGMFFAGQLAAVERAVRLLLKVSPSLPYARSMCGVFDRLPPADGTQSPFVDDPKKDAQIVSRPGSDLVVVLFCGRGLRLGLPLPVMHRWIGKLPASLIYLRDFTSHAYLKGVPSFGPDKRSAIAELRRQIERLHGRRVCCYGNSGGVYAALHYGLELGAQAVLCMAGKTNRTREFSAFSPSEHRAARLQQEHPDVQLDARRLYEHAPNPPRVRIVYGDGNWSDRRHAEHMAALKCVTLRPIEDYAGHRAALELITRGEYQQLLDWLVAPS